MQSQPWTPTKDGLNRKGSLLSWLDERIRILLLAPAFLVMLLVFLYPILYTVYLSVHDWTLFTMQDPPFIGFKHILEVLSDTTFHRSLLRSAIYVCAGVGLQLVLGFTLALAVDRIRRGQGLLTTLFVFPMMVTPVVVGLMWKFIFDYNFGIFNYTLTLFGLEKMAVLNTSSTALAALIFVDTWQWTPFMFIVLLAGLRSLPTEPFEAADIDGASAWQKLRNITLPLLKSVMIVCLVMRAAGAIKVFDQIYVLTGGGPGTSTETFSILLHRKAFAEFNFGYSSALAIVLAIIVGIICWFAVRSLYSEKQGATIMRSNRNHPLLYVYVYGALVIFLFPIFWVMFTSIKTPTQAFQIPPVWFFSPSLENYREVFRTQPFSEYLINSLITTVVSTLLALVIGTLAGYSLARFRIKGQRVITFSVFFTKIFPPIVLVVPFFVLFQQLGSTDSLFSLIVSYTTFNLPFVIWLMWGFLKELPESLEEAAIIDGTTRFGAMVAGCAAACQARTCRIRHLHRHELLERISVCA
jgi:ABC-type sugar transport system permease subunit